MNSNQAWYARSSSCRLDSKGYRQRLPAIIAGVFLLLLWGAPKSLTVGPAVFAIKDARIVTVSGPVIEKGTVVIRQGLIDAVAADTPIPEDAEIIDGTGMTVYPGLFDCHTILGQHEDETTPAQGRSARGGQPSPSTSPLAATPATTAAPALRSNMLAHVRVADSLTSDGNKLERARSAGITTALSVPRRGVFAGQSALINLTDDPSQMVVDPSVALHLLMESATVGGEVGRGTYPASLMGVLAYIKQGFLDTEHYAAAHAAYNGHRRGMERPTYNRSLEALQPFAARQEPVILIANTPAEIERAIHLAEAIRVKYILSGVQEGYKVAPLLKQKNVPVLVSLRFPERNRDADPELDEPLRQLKLRAEAPGNAATLHRAGVLFAFHSGEMSDPRDFLRNAARAVQAGLPKDTAVRALTLNAAEILGVEDQLGSIEKGKIANLIVASGDLLSERTQLRYVFIDGRRFEPAPDRPRGAEGPGQRVLAQRAERVVNATGTWNLQLESPAGPQSITAVLREQNGRISGTVTTEFGASDIIDGSASVSQIRFRASVTLRNETVEIEFVGTMEGDNIGGNAQFPSGSVAFSGTRTPNQEVES